MAPKPPPIDQPPTSRFVVLGRVVTMNKSDKVHPTGAVYVKDGLIDEVLPGDQPPPPGYDDVPRLKTNGTIFPGLIDLHNHLSYNALRLWDVPEKYDNRDQWAGPGEYHQLISGPMGILGKIPKIVRAVVRYVECKCLISGVTTGQGIKLNSAPGVARYYPGVMRNIEQTFENALPFANTRIGDVDAKKLSNFRTRLESSNTLFLHLSEGVNGARKHFADLQDKTDGSWVIAPNLVAIHCVGLQQPDIDIFAQHGAAMIWSPLSNLLLYGATAMVKSFKAAGVRMGLGCDWSPSGSKNMLGEMKVARVYSPNGGSPVFTDKEIVSMATRGASQIIGWQDALGTIEKGKRADFAVTAKAGDPYAAIIESTEKDIVLVAIEGVPRYGLPSFIDQFVDGGEKLTVGGQRRLLNLNQASQEPLIARVTLAQAKKDLTKALHDIPKLATKKAREAIAPSGPGEFTLALDETEDTNETFRLEVSPPDPVPRDLLERAPPLPLKALKLDPLTVLDDADFLDLLGREGNLPKYLAPAIRALY